MLLNEVLRHGEGGGMIRILQLDVNSGDILGGPRLENVATLLNREGWTMVLRGYNLAMCIFIQS